MSETLCFLDFTNVRKDWYALIQTNCKMLTEGGATSFINGTDQVRVPIVLEVPAGVVIHKGFVFCRQDKKARSKW